MKNTNTMKMEEKLYLKNGGERTRHKIFYHPNRMKALEVFKYTKGSNQNRGNGPDKNKHFMFMHEMFDTYGRPLFREWRYWEDAAEETHHEVFIYEYPYPYDNDWNPKVIGFQDLRKFFTEELDEDDDTWNFSGAPHILTEMRRMKKLTKTSNRGLRYI